MTRTIFLALLLVLSATPSAGQTNQPPVPAVSEDAGIATLPPKVCPSDFTDGPLYADGQTFYGIPARRYVEGFLAPPTSSHARVSTGTQNVSASSLRILKDGTDYDACLRLTAFISNGARSAPPSPGWVYFTAGGFYFVASWRPAQSLSDRTSRYAQVMVFDSTFKFLGAFAF
jgi:hypothetical protein